MQHSHDNKIVGPKTILLLIIIATLTLSSVIVISETQEQLFAKKGSHSSSSAASSSSSSLGGIGSSFPSSGNASTDDSGSRRSTTDFSSSPGSVDPTHCDQPGFPSCYNVGYSDGQANQGTSCPSGHSSAYCDGYSAGSRAATSSSLSSNSQSNNFAPENGGTGSPGTGSVYTANHHGFKSAGSKVNLNQEAQINNNENTTNNSGNHATSKSNIRNNANELQTLLPGHKSKGHKTLSSLHQNSNVNVNQTGQSNSNLAVTNSSGSHLKSESNIGNNAHVNSKLLNLLSSSHHKSTGDTSQPIKQNSKANVNQTGESNTRVSITNSSHGHVNSRSNIGNNVGVNSNLLNPSPSHKSRSHSPFSVIQNGKSNINQTGLTNTGINLTNSPNSSVSSKSNINNNAKVNSNVNNPSSSSHATYHYNPSSIKQKSNVNINQAGQTNTNVNVTNSPKSHVNSQSSISNNANVNSKVNSNNNNNNPFRYFGSQPSASSVIQNSKTTVNQGAENNANINVNNSPGTRVLNEQTIKQSVRINNELNNIIKNNEVNNIIKQNTISAPQQPLTDIVTVKLAISSMSSGTLFPLADVAPYRLIGGHLTANLPSSSQQNIVVAQVSDDGSIQHAVILDLNQVTGSNLDQNSLYETSLGSDISGTNPFTGNQDEVSSITNLFLWNNNQQSIVFDNANGVTVNLIYK